MYDARSATLAATRLDITDVEYTIVRSVVKARCGLGEVALFVGPLDDGITFDILRGVLQKLFDLGVATKSTLLVSRTDITIGSPIFRASEVQIGAVCSLLSRERAALPAVPDRSEDVQTILEGGEEALKGEAQEPLTYPLKIEGTPLLEAKLRIQRYSTTDPCVFVEGQIDDRIGFKLVTITNASDAHNALVQIYWRDGAFRVDTDSDVRADIDSAVSMMSASSAAPDRMTIFAWSTKLPAKETGISNADSRSWWSALKRVLLKLYDLKLSARQECADALVIARYNGEAPKAERLLTLIGLDAGTDCRTLRRREIGYTMPNTPNTPNKRKNVTGIYSALPGVGSPR